jgi:ATP-dependent DNA helicase RecG
VIHYRGENRIETLHEQVGNRGYANGFEGLVGFINARLPHNEVLGTALRQDVPMFPEISIRELVANALIHQDFSQTGTGLMIEIFDRRLEITNPGIPLIETDRFLHSPPKSRNEAFASLMRHVARPRVSRGCANGRARSRPK